MTLPGIYQQRNIIVYRDGTAKSMQVSIVVEKALKIYLNNRQISILSCSPGSWTELGVGFLFSQGLIQDRGQIKSIRCDQDDALWVETYDTTSRVDVLRDPNLVALPKSESRFQVSDLLEWIAELDRQSTAFRLTGGVHSAALAGKGHGLLVRFEDVGRHNAVDRVLGYMLLNGLTTADKCLVLSGRIASEIFVKAARARLPLIVSRSAPTMHTVQLAEQLGITVVGFARGSQLSVYSRGERIMFQ